LRPTGDLLRLSGDMLRLSGLRPTGVLLRPTVKRPLSSGLGMLNKLQIKSLAPARAARGGV